MMACVTDMRNKTVEQIVDLRKRGVGFLYVGHELGDDEVLAHVDKGCTSTDFFPEGVARCGVMAAAADARQSPGPPRLRGRRRLSWAALE